jgi:amino acid transporter
MDFLMVTKIKRFILGSPLNPFNPKIRKSISLIALFAWVGLGADALSSSCYGPEESFLALGAYPHLAIYIAMATVLTIFIISFGYNQVIELFPNGGGGYQVATKLLHPYAGLVSGSALIVDYVLTITVSIASGVDAIFSFLPLAWLGYGFYIKALLILLLLALNLRGMKEAIMVLLPIFLGFVIVHFILIIYGIAMHPAGLASVLPAAIEDTHKLSSSIGLLAVMGITLHAYSLGAGTYTGLEAVANNVQHLSEPRVVTGKKTMFYMAASLSFTAGGIILLYLLWNVHPVVGQTLNAVVFHDILGDSASAKFLLVLTLLLEGGLLFVAANTGFAGGPNVLANMAADGWMPHRFLYLSSRLVIQNGLILLGAAALAILFWSGGRVDLLVILYSINVFITFSLSLLSISIYWLKHRSSKHWKWHFLNSLCGFITTLSILCITIIYKFREGGWITILITCIIIAICYAIRARYRKTHKKLKQLDKLLRQPLKRDVTDFPVMNKTKATAIILIGKSFSMGMHTLLGVIRLFPNQFTNFVFLEVGVVDVQSFQGEGELADMKARVDTTLDYFIRYCHQEGYAADSYSAFGTEPMSELKKISQEAWEAYPNSIFFAGRLIFKRDNFITNYLHDQAALMFQRYLHLKGKELMIMPMQI